MDKNARIIAQFSHYINEGIIAFYIILIAIQFSNTVEAPYWSFLVILLMSAVLFSFIAYRELNEILYIIMIPILAFAFYAADYMISLVVVFSIVLTYRYYRIAKTDIKRREAGYLGTSAILVILLTVFNGDNEIYWIFLIQFFLTFIGFYLMNLVIVSKSLQSDFLVQFGKIIGIIVLAGGFAFLFLNEIVTRIVGLIWIVIGFLTAHISSFFAGLFYWVTPDPSIYDYEPEDEVTGIQSPELGESIMEGVSSYAIILIVLAFAVIIICIVYLFHKLRRPLRENEESEEVSEHQLRNDKMKQETNQPRKPFWQNFFKKPEHPARRLVFEFEKKLVKSNYARLSHETLEKWLARIGDGTELVIYQRVRYGDKDVSEEELNQLKQELNNLANRLN
ncbi:DUF4129 domain-containing protein [Oceanobacillus sp. CAU 1775]